MLTIREIIFSPDIDMYLCARQPERNASQEDLPKEIVALVGDSLALTCPIFPGVPAGEVEWVFSEEGYEEGEEAITLAHRGQVLTFPELAPENSGYYVCRVSNMVRANVVSNATRIVVLGSRYNVEMVQMDLNATCLAGAFHHNGSDDRNSSLNGDGAATVDILRQRLAQQLSFVLGLESAIRPELLDLEGLDGDEGVRVTFPLPVPQAARNIKAGIIGVDPVNSTAFPHWHADHMQKLFDAIALPGGPLELANISALCPGIIQAARVDQYRCQPPCAAIRDHPQFGPACTNISLECSVAGCTPVCPDGYRFQHDLSHAADRCLMAHTYTGLGAHLFGLGYCRRVSDAPFGLSVSSFDADAHGKSGASGVLGLPELSLDGMVGRVQVFEADLKAGLLRCGVWDNVQEFLPEESSSGPSGPIPAEADNAGYRFGLVHGTEGLALKMLQVPSFEDLTDISRPMSVWLNCTNAAGLWTVAEVLVHIEDENEPVEQVVFQPLFDQQALRRPAPALNGSTDPSSNSTGVGIDLSHANSTAVDVNTTNSHMRNANASGSVEPTLLVPENLRPGTPLVAFTFFEPDIHMQQTHSYEILGDSRGRFAVNASALAVVLGNGSYLDADGSHVDMRDRDLLDFEVQPSHHLQLAITDSGGLRVVSNFTLQLVDNNDVPELQLCHRSGDCALRASIHPADIFGSKVAMVRVSDQDPLDAVSAEFMDDDSAGLFAFNSTTFELTLARNMNLSDGEGRAGQEYRLRFRLQDTGSPPHNVEVVAAISVELPTTARTSSSAMSDGASVGIATAVCVLLLALVVIALVVRVKRRRRSAKVEHWRALEVDAVINAALFPQWDGDPLHTLSRQSSVSLVRIPQRFCAFFQSEFSCCLLSLSLSPLAHP